MEASNSQLQNNTSSKEMSSNQQVNKIFKTLKDHEKVNIFGPPGVGKTWMAKRASDLAIKKEIVNLTLWVFLCKEPTKDSLSKSIAQQLCLLPTTQEWEDGDDNKGRKDDHDEMPSTENLSQMLHKKLDGNKILLILEDVLFDRETEKNPIETTFWSVWQEMFPHVGFRTLLISRLRRKYMSEAVEVKAFPRKESESLLIEKLDAQSKMSKKIQALGKRLIEKSNGLPGTVTMIAKSLNYLRPDKSRLSMLEKELDETSENYEANKLLCKNHDVLPISVLKDLCWNGDHFFRDSASVNYNELITYWILEGYLGFGSMTSLYNKGHCILMELMDCGILKGQDGDYVFMDKSLINIADLYQCVDQIANLGLASVFTSETEGFGRMTHEDGMLKTPRTWKKEQTSKKASQNLSTLLLDGTLFSEQVMMGFLESEKELQVLALFNPTIKSLPKPLGTMEKLRVLVLRGCEFLQDFKLPLKGLRVLEISDSRSLKCLKSVFFKDMEHLRSLHLSGLQIVYLPQAVYSLLQLRWLVVKNCRRLKKLESLAKLEHLMVVDLSGNTSLETVDKNFLKFKNLQILNLSKTLVSTTPLLKNIGKLTHLLCRGCKDLGRLRGLTALTSLQTLDLSGSKDFEEFHDSSLESLKSLRTLNLSGTAIDRLPYNIANPRYLYLKSCLNLERFPCIESLLNLEVLDVSGSENLKEFEEGFFDRVTDLRVLNVSQTSIECLPSLSKLSNLRELVLSRCPLLARLPSLQSCTKLEVLDASHCSALEDIGNDSFEGMAGLQKIDLSETKIKTFPSLSNPSYLRQLLLKNCKAVQNLEVNVSLPNLEELNLSGITFLNPNGAEFVKDMSKLRTVDLSHASLKGLPSMSNLTSLTHLSLAGCSLSDTELDLDPLHNLEVLDLSRSAIKRLRNLINLPRLQKLLLKDCSMVEGFPDVQINALVGPNPNIPDEIRGITHLDYLEFPNLKVDTSNVECSSDEVNQEKWSICSLSEVNQPPIFVSGTQFLQTLEENSMREGPWHLCSKPIKVEGDRYLQRDELVFRDVYFQTFQFAQYKEKRSLQIRGFNDFPKGIENIISHINMVFLIDNKFKSLPTGFEAFVLNKLKGCWINRCDEMDTIFNEKEEKVDDSSSGIHLENLGISNNRGLECIYKGKQPFGSFDSFKSLYLDSCPKVSSVFTSSWGPKYLEVLQIKHCDKIVSLCETGGELPRLKTLHLWELPELENINLLFPSLQTLKIWECPKVKQIESHIEFMRSLQTLWVTATPSLKCLDGISKLPCLDTLILESCPMLEYVTSSLNMVRIMEIRSCEKLQTLFTHSSHMPCLNTLHLEDLPMLRRIGATFSSRVNLLALECPNLELDGTVVD